MILKNLFAVYYRLMVAHRNFLRKIGLGFYRSLNEDLDAAAVLAMLQVLFISVTLGWLLKLVKVHFPVWFILFYLLLFWYLIYLNNKVVSKNREKRRIILDNYANLSKAKKSIWIVLAIIIWVIPIYFFSLLLDNK
jgi:Ca2+/Na+ antiporter